LLVPDEVARAHIAQESAAILACAARNGAKADIDIDALEIRFSFNHPVDKLPLLLVADVHDYRAAPPAWRFLDPESGLETLQAYPSAGNLPGGGPSVINSHKGMGTICAHFNRLAYAESAGIHPDWAAATDWLTTAPGTARATNIPEMFQLIYSHCCYSPGRQGV